MNIFKNLHQQDFPLLLANVWDVPSAKIAETLGFQAIGTSSAAIAKMLGYQDGEDVPFEDLYYIVKRIKANTTLPLSVDIESGYSRDIAKIIQNVLQLVNLGVVGINLEDSIVNEERKLLPTEVFATTISTLKKGLKNKNKAIFLNVRTDTFLLNVPNRIEATLQRIRLYEKAGADSLFIPGLQQETDIVTILENTKLPLNVMCFNGLPDFKTLQNLGVQRISMGNFVFEKNIAFFEQAMAGIQTEESFLSIFNLG